MPRMLLLALDLLKSFPAARRRLPGEDDILVAVGETGLGLEEEDDPSEKWLRGLRATWPPFAYHGTIQ